MKCDAFPNRYTGKPCPRPATWKTDWRSGYLYYCGHHARYRKKDVSLKNWRRVL